MKIAIMQPYLFPYLGYFQLIEAVDVFVIHDDVQYIKGGWINRNYILVNGKRHLFSFGLKKESYQLNINQRYLSQSYETEKRKFLQTIDFQYRRAPNFKQSYEMITKIMSSNKTSISSLIIASLHKLCNHLGIQTKILVSSDLKNDKRLKGQDKVIDIVHYLCGTRYINLSGGQELYSKDEFHKRGIDLKFLRTKKIIYKQFNNEFVPDLSIIDVMMFNSKYEMRQLLDEYELF